MIRMRVKKNAHSIELPWGSEACMNGRMLKMRGQTIDVENYYGNPCYQYRDTRCYWLWNEAWLEKLTEFDNEEEINEDAGT